nr:hypothetical protein [Bacteroides sp.]
MNPHCPNNKEVGHFRCPTSLLLGQHNHFELHVLHILPHRHIHLVAARRIVWLRHRQRPCTNHRIDIDLHKIFPVFQSQML